MFFQDASEDPAMAALFVFTVASHRKVGLMRQRGQSVEDAACVGFGHLGLVALREMAPGCGVVE